jgi:hypothetical protein
MFETVRPLLEEGADVFLFAVIARSNLKKSDVYRDRRDFAIAPRSKRF